MKQLQSLRNFERFFVTLPEHSMFLLRRNLSVSVWLQLPVALGGIQSPISKAPLEILKHWVKSVHILVWVFEYLRGEHVLCWRNQLSSSLLIWKWKIYPSLLTALSCGAPWAWSAASSALDVSEGTANHSEDFRMHRHMNWLHHLSLRASLK